MKLATVLAPDGALFVRVRRGHGLRGVMATSFVVLAAGCAAYGAAMGLWRSPVQSLSAALKLPAMFVLTAVLTAVLDVVLCGLLRARVAAAQALTASLLAMAILGAILGSLAPLAAFASLQAPPPAGAATVAVADWLLTGHVVVMGVAGIVAVSRLRALLDALIPDPVIARRVQWAWMITHGVVGAQLSWVLRPFVGNPTLPVRVLRPDALDGSFFEAVFEMTFALMGPAGPISIGLVLLWVAAVVAMHLDAPVEDAHVDGGCLKIRRRGARTTFDVPLSRVRHLSVQGTAVIVHWVDAGSLERSVERLPTKDSARARALYESIAWARSGGEGYRAPQ